MGKGYENKSYVTRENTDIHIFNLLPNSKILDFTNSKTYAHDKFNVVQVVNPLPHNTTF